MFKLFKKKRGKTAKAKAQKVAFVEEVDATEEYELRVEAIRVEYEHAVAAAQERHADDAAALADAVAQAKAARRAAIEALNAEYEFEDDEAQAPAAGPSDEAEPVEEAAPEAATQPEADAAEPAASAEPEGAAEPDAEPEPGPVDETAAAAPDDESDAEPDEAPAPEAAVEDERAEPQPEADVAAEAADDGEADYAEEYEQRRAQIVAQFDAAIAKVQPLARTNPSVFAAAARKAKQTRDEALLALDDEYEFIEEDDEAGGAAKPDNPLSYDNVQAMTDDLNVLAREGMATARELKEISDEIKGLMDFKDMFKL